MIEPCARTRILITRRHSCRSRAATRSKALAAPHPIQAIPASGQLLDLLGRPLRDLRISVTDRCNFRCSYCMPKEVFDQGHPYLPHSALLRFEEITRLAKVFVAHGVRKIRLTGGEPLLRKDLEQLVEQLAALRTPDGQPLDLTLTTNGSLLARKARALKDAGLQRVTVSLDALDDAIFRRMNDVDFPVRAVLDGLEAAQAALTLLRYDLDYTLSHWPLPCCDLWEEAIGFHYHTRLVQQAALAEGARLHPGQRAEIP